MNRPPDASPITVLAVDDNVVVRAGLVALLDAADDITVIGEAGDGAQAIERAHDLNPDLTLLDVRMPVLDGIGAVEQLSRISKVVMLTHTEDSETIHSALRKGASGYLVHGHFTPDELSRALHGVMWGNGTPLSPVAATAVLQSVRGASDEPPSPTDQTPELGLTDREVEILAAAVRGLANPQIARELFLAEKTVKNHLNRIFRKLGVSTRSEAIALWYSEIHGVGPRSDRPGHTAQTSHL